MLYLFGLVIATGFGVAFAAIAGSIGQGRATAAAVEAMARQPENSGAIRNAMIIGLALIESLTIYALVIGFILSTKLPNVKDILEVISGGH
jgi:F-type H+-transporting ATPase subunit c